MTWNHRVLRYEDGTFGIHEVYYNDDGEPWGFTESPAAEGDNPEELIETLTRMVACIAEPVLNYEDF